MPSKGLQIVYAPRADATPERELDALVSIYRLAIDRYLETKAVDGTRQSERFEHRGRSSP